MTRAMVAAARMMLLGAVLEASGQDISRHPTLFLSDSTLGRELVLWTQTETPRPASGRAVANRVAGSEPAGQDQNATLGPQTSTQTVTGMIVRVGNSYILKTSDNRAYRIDNPEQMKQYEGRLVKIVGSVSIRTNVLHVTSITPVP